MNPNPLALTSSFSTHFINIAKAAKVKRLIDAVTEVDMSIIRNHARKYFRHHKDETTVVYEVYLDGRGQERIASRSSEDDPPENVVARGTACRFTRSEYKVAEQEIIRLLFDYEPDKLLDLKAMKQLTYERRG